MDTFLDDELDFERMAKEELSPRLGKLLAQVEPFAATVEAGMVCSESLEELMRTAHNLKALAGYAKQASVAVYAHELESVFSSLQKGETKADRSFVSWLQGVKGQLAAWIEQLEDGVQELRQEQPPATSAMVYSLDTLGETLQRCTLLLLEGDTPKTAYLQHAQRYLGKVIVTGSAQEALHYAQLHTNEPILLASDATREKKLLLPLLEAFAKKVDQIPIIVLENNKIPAKYRQMYLQSERVEFFLRYPAEAESLEHALSLVASNRFMEKTIRLGRHDEIMRYIHALTPLPSSVRELNRLRSDPEATLKEVSDVVTRDPALSSKILQMVGSAAMGLTHHVASIHQAITLLGKERVLAIAMQESIGKALPAALAPYGLEERQFYDTSIRRMNLMMYWFMKVAISKVGLLVTAALIANIGQLVIARTISRNGKSAGFLKTVQEKGAKAAELEFVHTTAEAVTVDVLTHWQIDSEIIGALKYCNNPMQAPETFRTEALALFIVNETIRAESAQITPRTIERMASEVAFHQLNPGAFRQAVERMVTPRL